MRIFFSFLFVLLFFFRRSISKCFTEDGKRVENDKWNSGCKFRVLDMAADTSRSRVISLIRDLFYAISITISAIL